MNYGVEVYPEGAPLSKISIWEYLCTAWEIISSAIPVSIMLSIQILMTFVNLIYIGIFDNDVLLGGVGIGNMWINCCGLYIIVAINMGL